MRGSFVNSKTLEASASVRTIILLHVSQRQILICLFWKYIRSLLSLILSNWLADCLAPLAHFFLVVLFSTSITFQFSPFMLTYISFGMCRSHRLAFLLLFENIAENTCGYKGLSSKNHSAKLACR